MIRESTYRATLMYAMVVLFFPGCSARDITTGISEVHTVQMRPLWDSTKAYAYFGRYTFLIIRPSGISRALDVSFDSVSYAERARVLYVSGQVIEYGSAEHMVGTQVVIGPVIHDEIEMISEAEHPQDPFPMDRFRIIPQYESATDSEGRFSLSAVIDSSSSLMIATKGVYLNLYEIGKLVDSSWTQ